MELYEVAIISKATEHGIQHWVAPTLLDFRRIFAEDEERAKTLALAAYAQDAKFQLGERQRARLEALVRPFV